MKYFDAHCHIQFDGYDEDREALIESMREQEIGALVVGVDLESSRKAVVLAQLHPHLFASVGLHPNDVAEEEFGTEAFEKLAQDGKVVAIGECGLDYFRPTEPEAMKQKQREVFEAHIELAGKLGKPLMIHARPSKGSQDAYEDALSMLESAKREYGENLTGDFHFFVGNAATALRAVDLGFTVSYTAVLTFTHDYDDVVRSVPLSHLLTETDSPFVAPAPNRGKRNDPLAVKAVVEAIAVIRNESLESIRLQLAQNASRIFNLPTPSAPAQ